MDKRKEELTNRILVAGHQIPADLVIKNANIINVFTGEEMTGDVAIANGVIAGIGNYEGKTEIDAQGRHLIPGLIDGHVHIESAMVTPKEFAKVVIPHGVTTVIADPHEIANVHGLDGIHFMLNASVGIPLDVFYMLPSCVPATPFENAGAILSAEDLAPLYHHPRVLGLAEVMDFPSVASTSPEMLNKLADANRYQAKIDGHAAGIPSDSLNIYMAAGIKTDHECVTASEAKARLDAGMYLMIRQGSVARDLEALLPAVTASNARRCLFVTDDKHLDDILYEGSIDFNVRLAIKQGIPAITAIQMATLHAAECFGLSQLGAIAPGYQADMVLLDDLETLSISHVYKRGQLVYQTNHIVSSAFPDPPATTKLPGSVKLNTITDECLAIPLTSNQCHVIEIIPNSLITNHLIEEVDVDHGLFKSSTTKDLLKLAVLERHHRTGNIGLGIVKGLGLKKGAIASTVAHDSHNLICAGVNDEDMLSAIRYLEKVHGGLAVVSDGQVIASLPLPIAGLMTDRPYTEVYDRLHLINEALRTIGASQAFNPFLTLSFLALPVIPHLKLTDLGLFDFSSFSHINIEDKKI
ncbi:adenine deaminase [Ammoniphilus sp. CFH 90114]|uniref:adenine deaminase n=1 Tax=Ammoniphilus sp. CFH 90114 TaxID=2493665 RepID=UPI00100EE14C|nr:adenine deaminase [Ammoniphilus sp. CFH 90114]RXT14845.1 adenine deaminase [Ammoniphilus sp. CFH 90114]